jgi:Carboxypeptidase regulatory-like domain
MSTRIRRFSVAAAVVFGFVSAAAAQSVPSQRGLVRDHTGTPLAGAVVTVQHPDKLAIRVALTDLQGEYSIEPLEGGVQYVVRVSHPRYRRAQLRASAGEPLAVNLKPKRCSADRKER